MARTRKIDDVGAYIPGAKKNWQRDFMTLEDLKAMSENEIILEAKKDNVWPKPNYAKLVANGMEPKAAAIIKIIRDRLSAEPTPAYGLTALQSSHNYVEMMTRLRDRLEAVTTFDDVKMVLASIKEEYANPARGMPTPSYPGSKPYFSVFGKQKSPLYLDYSDIIRANRLVDSRFHEEKADWQKGFKVHNDGYNRFYIKKLGVGKLKEKFASVDEAWEWIERNHATIASIKPKAAKKVSPREKPHLAKIVRSGRPDYREGTDISAEGFRATFNFNAVQFGEWLPDNERQEVLNMAYDSLMDFADALGLDPEALSLDGTLAVAFGARGTGRAAAQYHPAYHIFNLTRMNGAGCVAHEWAHALDFFLARGSQQSVQSGILAISGDCDIISPENVILRVNHKGQELAKAASEMIEALTRRPLTAAEKIEDLHNQLKKTKAELEKYEPIVEEQYSKALAAHEATGTKRKFTPSKQLKGNLEWIERRQRAVKELMALISETETVEPGEIVGKKTSEYYERAQYLDSHRADRYFSQPTELMARALESYVFDKLAENGGKSDYLVHSVCEADYDPEVYQGSPYIQGPARRYINEKMEAFIEAARPVLENKVAARMKM